MHEEADAFDDLPLVGWGLRTAGPGSTATCRTLDWKPPRSSRWRLPTLKFDSKLADRCFAGAHGLRHSVELALQDIESGMSRVKPEHRSTYRAQPGKQKFHFRSSAM